MGSEIGATGNDVPATASSIPPPSYGAYSDGQPMQPTSKLQHVQSKVDDAKSAVAGNIELLIQRGEKLEDLDTAAVVFNDNAREFQKGATGVNRKMSWKKWKWYLVCIIIALIICSGLIVAIVLIIKK